MQTGTSNSLLQEGNDKEIGDLFLNMLDDSELIKHYRLNGAGMFAVDLIKDAITSSIQHNDTKRPAITEVDKS